MRKLVVLKLDGDLNVGVRVTLEIGEEGLRPSTEISGQLPPNPDMVTAIEEWRSTYHSLGRFARIKAKKIIYDGSITQQRSDCHNKACELRSHLNNWLLSESFHPIREKWLKHLMPDDEVRVLIRTASMQLEKLPWHLWDLLDRDYQNAGVALSVPESEQVAASQKSTYRNKVRILAILGDSAGINVQQDRQLLEELPGAATVFLVEPQRQDINDLLWNQPWDILFFAGHSKTEGDTGRIYINDKDSLTIEDLRYALRNAIAGGLHLAIFNSCDGLGLARELQDLHIPQIIVMGEPVPDMVAQEFLRHFLTAFSSGQSLYAAVRLARQRLQGKEDDYPCASWLPVICQNPALMPLTWKELLGSKSQHRLISRSLRRVILASVVTTAVIIGLRYLGLLQALELQAFDQLQRLRPDEGPDPRLLVVTVTEKDVQSQPIEERRGVSLSDRSLAKLLEKLESYQPRVIGLDIYRENRVRAEHVDLATRLRQSDRFIAICKAGDSDNNAGISAPPEITAQRLGFSDVVGDPDGIIRRQLLAMAPASPCNTDKSFNFRLALRYLAEEGIQLKLTTDEYFQLGTIVFKTLEENSGGYHQVDTRGHQVLINYRSSNQVATQVTLTDVLNNKLSPELVKDRIVIIGTTAESFHDYWLTPYSAGHSPLQQMPGVVVQAHMVSQLLSTVLDNRPLFWFWPKWGEALWVWGWSLVGGLLAWRVRSLLHLGLVGGAALGTLSGLCFVLLIKGAWVPLVPSALALLATGGSVVVYTASQSQKPK